MTRALRQIVSLAFVPMLLLAAGVAFTVYLVAQVPDEVFFNGDGGMKFLLVKQFAAGYWGTDIRLPDDAFERELWTGGFFPFALPFVYWIDGHFVQCFPIFFPLLSAPFYVVLGFRGLYVIPLVSLWVIWLRFWFLCRQFSLPWFETTLGLFALIFASPLTLYGATFWEHTLAVALGFCGFAETLGPRGTVPSNGRLLMAGLLMGLAGWLRPENVCFAAAAVLAWPIMGRSNGRLWSWLSLIAGTGATVGLFAVFNLILYHHPLGAHSFYVLKSKGFLDHLWYESRPLLGSINAELFQFVPVAYVAAGGGLLTLFMGRGRWTSRVAYLIVTALLCSLFVPAIINHSGGLQWGPRYLLSSVPLICLLGVLVLDEVWGVRPADRIRYGLIAFALLLLVGFGFQTNSITGSKTLVGNYRARVLKGLRMLRERDEHFVIVNHPYIPLELTSVWEQKRFLGAGQLDQFQALLEALHRQGTTRFLLISSLVGSPLLPGDSAEELPQILVAEWGNYRVECRLLGGYSKNDYVYEGLIETRPVRPSPKVP